MSFSTYFEDLERLPPIYREVFPTGQRRKKSLVANKQNIAEFVKRFARHGLEGRYSWLDSGADEETQDGKSFASSFRDVIPEVYKTRGIAYYIREVLAGRSGKAIGIEFGGIGVRAFNEFGDFFKKSVGITLVDHRVFEADGVEMALLDEGSHGTHKVLVGDILDPETYVKLQNLLKGEMADLIIERMAKGLEFMPLELYQLFGILNTWYSLLRENGIMFVQVPHKLEQIFVPWAEMLIEKYTTLDVAYSLGTRDSGLRQTVLRIRKLPGCPKNLPWLDRRIVWRISRGIQRHAD